MSDYQRFVSYLYDYQNNIKSKNCGFCRVELRDHNCRLEVHLKLPLYPFTPTLKVYVFVPSKEKLYGIFLGNASYHQGNVSGTFTFSEKNIMNSDYQFSQLGGIFIQTDTGFCFASAWKDLNIHPEKFVLYEKSTNPSNSQTNHTKELKPELSLPNSNKTIALDKSTVEPDQPDVKTSPALSNEAENISDSAVQSTTKMSEDQTYIQGNTTQEPEITIEQESEKQVTQKPIDSQQTENTPQTNSIETTTDAAIKSETEPALLAASMDTAYSTKPTQSASCSTCTIKEDMADGITKDISKNNTSAYVATQKHSNNFWENILKSYPQCHPFFDDEIHNCVQLSANDVQKISSSGFPICNNAFFRHNCQSFQHFLIGKKDCSSASGKAQYILAIPGLYNPKEQYMASMFGFPYFKRGQNSKCRNNCWGYWYRILPEYWEDCKI